MQYSLWIHFSESVLGNTGNRQAKVQVRNRDDGAGHRGSGSGKSAYAEKMICEKHRQLCGTAEKPPLYYIADMVPYGRETEKKIEAHRKMRAGKGFATIEWYVDLPGRILGPDSPDLKGSYVLLECISNLTANEMYEPRRRGKYG